MSYSVGLKPLSELERLCVCRAVVVMFALKGERADVKSLMRGAGSHFDYGVADDLYEFRDVARGLMPRFAVEGEEGEGSFRVESLVGWEPRVEPGVDYWLDAVVRVAELMVGREFDGWETEECKVGLLCSCGGVFVCPSRRRVIEFLREAQAHTEFVGSESVVAVLSAIQDGLNNPWELPRPDGYDSEPHHKIWAWKGDAYTDTVLIPWACQRLGIWYEGDYELTKRVLSMTVEDAMDGELEPVASVAPERSGELEPAGGKVKRVNVQASGGVEEPTANDELTEPLEQGEEVTIEVGSVCQPEPNAGEEPKKRRSWFRRLLGV